MAKIGLGAIYAGTAAVLCVAGLILLGIAENEYMAEARCRELHKGDPAKIKRCLDKQDPAATWGTLIGFGSWGVFIACFIAYQIGNSKASERNKPPVNYPPTPLPGGEDG